MTEHRYYLGDKTPSKHHYYLADETPVVVWLFFQKDALNIIFEYKLIDMVIKLQFKNKFWFTIKCL